LEPFLKKIKDCGLGQGLSSLLPGFDVEKFVIKKIKGIVLNKREVELGRFLGKVEIFYLKGIVLEPVGLVGLMFKNIVIPEERILQIFRDILGQIDKKYFSDDYIPQKINSILKRLSEDEIYVPENLEDKTLFDLLVLILFNYYMTTGEVQPQWFVDARKKSERQEFARDCINFLIDTLLKVFKNLSENIYLDYSITFDSPLLRTFLNRKTNNGQLNKILEILGVDFQKILDEMAKKYIGESFVSGFGTLLVETIRSMIFGYDSSFLSENKKNLFNLTMTFGSEANSRNFRWFGNLNNKKCDEFFEISEDKFFSRSRRVRPTKCVVTLARSNLIAFGVVSKFFTEKKYKYSVTINNLKQDRTYYYRIFSNERKYSGEFTCENNKDKNFKFVAVSDSQGMIREDYELFLENLQSALETAKNAEFIVHLGDFVDDGKNENHWDFLLNNPLWGKYAVIPVAGNHDYRFNPLLESAVAGGSLLTHFNISINLSENQDISRGFYNYYEYKNTLFIILNTNTSNEIFGIDSKQYEEIYSIAKSSNAKWKIILTHKSAYSNGPHCRNKDVLEASKDILKLAAQCEVDFVIGGHDHVYSRSSPSLLGKLIKDENIGIPSGENLIPQGTVFVTLGASGVKNYEICKNAPLINEVLIDLKCPSYLEVEIDDEKINVTSRKYMPSSCKSVIIDRFEIEKRMPEPGNVLQLESMIQNLPELPTLSWRSRVQGVMGIYNLFPRDQRKKIKNINKLLRAKGDNIAYNETINGDVSIVHNKETFIQALNDVRVRIIIVKCYEIKFENSIGVGRTLKISRNLCLRGDAKLSFVSFILEKGITFIVGGNIRINNKRKIFSVFPAINTFILRKNSTLAVGGSVLISGAFGVGSGRIFKNSGKGTRIFGI
jgi:predicted phosphodiesterase